MKKFGYLILFAAAVIVAAAWLKGDFAPFMLWWAVIALCGIIFLPAGISIFKGMNDKGYLFSKSLGIITATYLLWLLSSLRILPFGSAGAYACLLAVGLAIFLIPVFRTQFIQFFKVPGNVNLIILEEALFFICLLFWTILRGQKPEISGLEKFMDFGFINSVIRSPFAPPTDMWMAGSPINYYYFGQYITAFLTVLTGITPAITYNLMMATLFAFTFVLSFSLIFNVIRSFYPIVIKPLRKNAGKTVKVPGKHAALTGGLIAAFAVSMSGNLHSVIFSVIVPAVRKLGNYKGETKAYWFPDATRYIGYNPPTNDKTIHEFPLYSFVVSDLHAHVVNIIFVLTILTVLFIFLTKAYSIKASAIDKRWYLPEPLLLIAGFLIGTFHMTNYWDFPIYFTVTLLIIFVISLRNYGFSWKMLLNTIYHGVMVFIISYIVALPFTIKFIKNVGGIKLAEAHSPLYQLLVLWGCPLVFIIAFIVHIASIDKGWKTQPVSTATEIDNNKPNFILSIARKLHPADIFALILGICAIGLVIAPEIVYIQDIYTGDYKRANTMFKLTYQSFIMFGLVMGYIFARIGFSGMRPSKNTVMKTVLAILFACTMIYPFQAIKSWYGTLDQSKYKGLDGLAFMEEKYPDDLSAIKWLNSNVKGDPSILEADGLSYTDSGRISMATGLPTIVGWFTHEHLWRGNPEIVTGKVNEVKLIYENGSLDESSRLLKKYNIRYIIIGKIERDKFKALDENKLLSLGRIVFDTTGTKIIEVK